MQDRNFASLPVLTHFHSTCWRVMQPPHVASEATLFSVTIKVLSIFNRFANIVHRMHANASPFPSVTFYSSTLSVREIVLFGLHTRKLHFPALIYGQSFSCLSKAAHHPFILSMLCQMSGAIKHLPTHNQHSEGNLGPLHNSKSCCHYMNYTAQYQWVRTSPYKDKTEEEDRVEGSRVE